MILMRRVMIGGEEWRIIGVYVSGDIKEKLEKLRR